MVDIRALPGRQRLMMVFKGQVTETELERAEQELAEALPNLGPTFDMISDVSAAEKLSAPVIERIRGMGSSSSPPGCVPTFAWWGTAARRRCSSSASAVRSATTRGSPSRSGRPKSSSTARPDRDRSSPEAFRALGGTTHATAVGRCAVMGDRALDRFWRGVREPWDLLARMRHDRPLWRRYWRTVLVQAALALVAGVAVFWVVKHGADAWNDAFGPEDVTEAGASPVVGAPRGQGTAETSNASAPAQADEAPARPSETPRTPRPGKRVGPGTPGSVPPPPPAPAGPGEPPATAIPSSAPPEAARHGPPATAAPPSDAPEATRHGPPATADEDADEDEETDDGSGKDDESVEATIEQKVKALQEAPPEERGKRTAELVAAAVQQAKKEAGRAQTRAGKSKGKSPEEDAADELQQDREDVGDKIGELSLAAEALAHEFALRCG
jgi:hypothetical protein